MPMRCGAEARQTGLSQPLQSPVMGKDTQWRLYCRLASTNKVMSLGFWHPSYRSRIGRTFRAASAMAARRKWSVFTGCLKAFREKPESQIFAKRRAPLIRCTRSAFS